MSGRKRNYNYLDEVSVCRLDPDPVLVEGAAHDLERLRQRRRGGGGDDDAVAGADAHELAAGRPEVERRLVDPPQLHCIVSIHFQKQERKNYA